MICEIYLNKSIKKEKVKYIYDILECVTFKLRADPNQVEAKKAIVSSAIQYAFWEVTPNPDKLHPILSPKHPCRFRYCFILMFSQVTRNCYVLTHSQQVKKSQFEGVVEDAVFHCNLSHCWFYQRDYGLDDTQIGWGGCMCPWTKILHSSFPSTQMKYNLKVFQN